MGRKSLGWSAIVLGILGVLLFVILGVFTLLAREAVRDWTNEYLEPADQAIRRLANRMVLTGQRTESAEQEAANLIATGADRVLEKARSELIRLQMDLIALEASILSVDSGMEIIAALPLFPDERRGFKQAVATEVAVLRDDLSGLDARLVEAQALAAKIRQGGDAAEQARIALKALAQEITPTITAVTDFLVELGLALEEVRIHLGEARTRVGRGLTTVTVTLCFVFAWLAFAHFCVYLAGKRLLEEHARMGQAANPSTPA